MATKSNQSNSRETGTNIVCTRVTKMDDNGSVTIGDKTAAGPVVKATKWEKVVSVCSVDRELLPMKAHFFFFFGGLAGVIPPLVLYCQQLGASVSMVGVLFAVLPFVQCISKPIAGGIADKWQQHKAVFLVSMFILTITLFSINFIPEADLTSIYFNENVTLISCDRSVRFSACPSNNKEYDAIKMQRISCNLTDCSIPNSARPSVSFLFNDQNCPFNETADCQGLVTGSSSAFGLEASLRSFDKVANRSSCPEFNVKSITTPSNQSFELFNTTTDDNERCFEASFNCLAKCSTVAIATKQSNVGVRYEMVWMWTACIIAWSAYAIILSISDAILMNTLGENRSAFGYTRLYSSIGWGLLSAISAQIIDYASIGRPQKDYSPGFYIFFGLMICDIVTAFRMKVAIYEKPQALAKDLWNIFKRPEVIIFSIAVLLQGMVTGFLWTFVIVYANELNGTQLVIGLNYAVECFVSEIPFFMASGWIVNKLGHSNSMSFVLLVTGFKTLCYSFIDDAYYILIIALCHGVTYAVMYASVANFASVIAPASVAASIQGIFQALLEGAGVGLGNLFGGFVYQAVGGRLAFRYFGIALLIISVIHWLTTVVLKRSKSRSVSPEIVMHSTNVSDHFVDVILESKSYQTVKSS